MYDLVKVKRPYRCVVWVGGWWWFGGGRGGLVKQSFSDNIGVLYIRTCLDDLRPTRSLNSHLKLSFLRGCIRMAHKICDELGPGRL